MMIKVKISYTISSFVDECCSEIMMHYYTRSDLEQRSVKGAHDTIMIITMKTLMRR
jgi:hypothetical protein